MMGDVVFPRELLGSMINLLPFMSPLPAASSAESPLRKGSLDKATFKKQKQEWNVMYEKKTKPWA